MAIYRLMQNSGFRPEQSKVMASTYEGALIDLKITDSQLTELVAKKIIEWAPRGCLDPTTLRAHSRD